MEKSIFNRGANKMLPWTQESKFGKEREEEKNAPFRGLEDTGCGIFFGKQQRRERVPLGLTVVIALRRRGSWPQTQPVSVATVPAMLRARFQRVHPVPSRGVLGRQN